MSKLKLTYFDFHGGRGEPARLALSIGEIPFEDDRVPPAEWEGLYVFLPLFGAMAAVNSPAFCFTMQIAMLAGFITSYPVNWWLIKVGIKERM